MATYRIAEIKDAEKLLDYIIKVKSENLDTLFKMLHTPTITEEKDFIKSYMDSGGIIFMAEDNDIVVGLLTAGRYFNTQLKHSLKIGITVLKGYRDKGIGTQLMMLLFEWSKFHDVKRIELEVFSNNQKAIKLYKRLGFETEGIKKKAVLINGEYKDIIQMVYWINRYEQ